MTDDSPPEFITIRTPGAVPTVDVYEVALELVRLVHLVVEASGARFHLKDRIDRATTSLAVLIARARDESAQKRWRVYREVLALVTDIATLLDVLDKQAATSRPGDLAGARYIAQRLRVELAPLAALHKPQ
jgi:hypothetical protein